MMSSSIPRNTPNLAVPLTQTTAPVIKFQCLFTHDLRRKAKRWHDGYLRFHTFNRRVMVYDSSSNFIGDLHWRESEGVQDGDEMELDKGVLIQVGESIGKTETDLAPLFEKKKQDQASPPSNGSARQPPQPHTPRPQAPAVHPRQRDTSLSSILGINRTPIANLMPARKPSASSDPATHIFTSNDAQERPRKRRKESPENAPVQRVNLSGRNEQNTANAFEVPRRDTSPSKVLPPANESRRKDQELPKSTNLVSRPAPYASKPTSSREPAAPTGLSRNKSPLNTGFANSQDSESGTLRISTQKPRKKLMYSALLPQNGSQSGSKKRQKPSSNLDSSVGLQNAPIGHRICPTDIGDLSDLIDHFSSDDFLDGAIAPHIADANYINESPSDSSLVALADLIAAEESPIPRSRAPRTLINSHDLPQLHDPNGQAAKPLPDSRDPFELEIEDASIAPQVVSKQPRQFLRSHSETGALKRRAPAQFPSSPPPMPPLKEESSITSTRQVNSGVAEHSPTKVPATRLFQKSISDLSSLRSQNGKHPHSIISTGKKHPVPITEDDEDVQGPWTSEALDLFDWWPPGKPKPA